MFLQALLGHLALVQHQLGHPVTLQDPIVSAQIILGPDELGDDGFELFAVRLGRSIPDVHLVRGEADERVQDQRRRQVVVLRELLGRHARRGRHFLGSWLSLGMRGSAWYKRGGTRC